MKSSTSRNLKLASGDWTKIRNDAVYGIAHDFKLLVEGFLSDLGKLDEFRLMHRDELAGKSSNGDLTKEQFEILVKEWG